MTRTQFVPSLFNKGEQLCQCVAYDPAGVQVRCVWAYRDRSLEKDSRFPVKLFRRGPNESKCMIECGRVVVSEIFLK